MTVPAVRHDPPKEAYILPLAVLGGYLLYKNTKQAHHITEWVKEKAKGEAGWTAICLIYGTVILGTFYLGYKHHEWRPSLVSWYVF